MKPEARAEVLESEALADRVATSQLLPAVELGDRLLARDAGELLAGGRHDGSPSWLACHRE
jgi:hypothetical protein